MADLHPIPFKVHQDGRYALRVEADLAPPWAVHHRTGTLLKYVSDAWFANQDGWEDAVAVPVHGWKPLEEARAGVMHGVMWNPGDYDSVQGVSVEDALTMAVALIAAIDRLGGV